MLDAATYTLVTGDTAPEDLADLVTHVVGRLEDALGRPLTYATRTERCRVYSDGVAYPACTPVETAVGYETDGVAVYTGGRGNVDIEYTGGYSPVDGTGDGPECPAQLAAAIAWGVHTLRHPLTGTLPADVQSLSIAGEYSVTRTAGSSVGADGRDLPRWAASIADLGGRCAAMAGRWRRR